MTAFPRTPGAKAVVTLLLAALMPFAAWATEAPLKLAAARLSDVRVSHQPDATVVHIKTKGAAQYRARLFSAPDRLVVDLDSTVFGWMKNSLEVGTGPLKQVRASQHREGVARVVLDFTRRVGYAIREDADGLSIIIPTAVLAPSTDVVAERTVKPAPAPPATASSRAKAAMPPATADVMSSSETTTSAAREIAVGLQAAQPAEGEKVAQAGTETKAEPPAAESSPTPAQQRAAGRRLISLDFKDADVVNLIRILAAENNRNIVIGDDVKGKMSISLRNVPWDLALTTILEARGLQKVEREGVLRIVSTEQLTKEREASARVEEAKIKGEAEARAKLAEAQVKEAEATTKRLAAEAAAKEAEARGPLREETVRLSYADPEEVENTLQGILGIPKEGTKALTGAQTIGGGPLIAEPPFSQLYGQQPPPSSQQTGPISVSQEVLNKGLTIRAHKPTNTIFLRLYSADLERVKKLIKEALDIPLPQVKIEARMEILDRNALTQIGIQWGGLVAGTTNKGNESNPNQTVLVGQGLQTTTVGGQSVPFQPGFVQGTTQTIGLVPIAGGAGLGPGVLAQPGVTPPAIPPATGGLPVSFQTGLPSGANLVNLPISTLPNAGPLPAAGLAFGIVGSKFNINLALQALTEQGKTRTLARPEIVTVENAKAVMSLGEEIPYATISSAGTQIQFKEALLKLEVTPTVIREPNETKIKMVVIVENNDRGETVNLGNAGQPPAINRRKAETQVLVREGERLILGGVQRSVNQNTVRKVPVFGDIPLLGWLFKVKEDFESGRELVVFITPSVLKVAGQASAAAMPPAASPAAPTPPAK